MIKYILLIDKMNQLILDVKAYIASFDENVWVKMVLCDDVFKNYAYTKEGINQFINHFTKSFYSEHTDATFLFDKMHSINDQCIIMFNCQYWYYYGEKHRENDLPAIIYPSGTKVWYHHGKIHRENDLPAYMYSNGDNIWYYHDRIERKNGLPKRIYVN